MGIRSKDNIGVSDLLKKDLDSLSNSLRSLQLTIADATYILKNHVMVNQKDLKIIEMGIGELDELRMQLISLSSVGSKTYQRLNRDESLIQSLRIIKGTINIDESKSLSRTYLKSRNSILSLLKDNIERYSEEEIHDEEIDLEEIDKAITERVKYLLLSFPMRLVNAYCQFFYDIKKKVDLRSRKVQRKGSQHIDVDNNDIKLMRSLYNLAEGYKDVLLKDLTSIEELVGIIKGVHISQLQFDIPLIENLSFFSLSVVLGAALAIRELEDKH